MVQVGSKEIGSPVPNSFMVKKVLAGFRLSLMLFGVKVKCRADQIVTLIRRSVYSGAPPTSALSLTGLSGLVSVLDVFVGTCQSPELRMLFF